MQKLTAFLEKNVQWVVVGLGAAYLLYMVWSYVINPPVVVDVGGTQGVVPGDVDQQVLDKQALTLKGKMDRAGAPPSIVPAADPLADFLKALDAQPKFDGLPTVVWMPPTGKLEAVTGGATPQGPGNAVGGVAEVEKLPEIPPAVEILMRRGRSTAAVPDPAGQPNPQFAALGPITQSDEDWVTVRFTVPKDELVKSFTDANIPQMVSKTHFLRVELVRQEMQPDGNWGPEEIVPAMKTPKLEKYPQTPVEQATYNEWSRTHQGDIVQPPFYTTIRGDMWAVPGEEPMAAGGAAVFNPEDFIDPASDLSQLTAEQKSQVMAARRAAKAEEERLRREQNRGNPGQNRGTPGAGEMGPGGRRPAGRGPGFSASPSGEIIPSTPFQNAPPPAAGEFSPQGQGQPRGEFSPGFQPEQQQQQQNTANFPLPPGEFDPNTLTADVTGWAHDDTVEPGKTYRYKVRYRLKNPVYQTSNVARDDKLVLQFDLVAADSEWTTNVTIPALTSFFIAANFDPDASRSVKFEVFKFQDGVLHQQTDQASPGDTVGEPDKSVDFNTGYTVVDIRRDVRGAGSYILLADPSGRLIARTYREDQADTEFKKLKEQLSGQATASGPGPG